MNTETKEDSMSEHISTPPESQGIPERPKWGKLGDGVERHLELLESLLSASRDEVAKVTAERDAAQSAICDWESREAAVCSEEETFEDVIKGLRGLEPFWSAAAESEIKAHEETSAQLAAMREALTFLTKNCTAESHSPWHDALKMARLALLPPQPRPDEEVSNG